MKTKKISKKLSLNTATVSNFDIKQMVKAKGGDNPSDGAYICDTDYYVCGTGICPTKNYPCTYQVPCI